MAEKMRYENEIENEKVDDEFNNSEDDLSVEDIYRVYMEDIAAIPGLHQQRCSDGGSDPGSQSGAHDAGG